MNSNIMSFRFLIKLILGTGSVALCIFISIVLYLILYGTFIPYDSAYVISLIVSSIIASTLLWFIDKDDPKPDGTSNFGTQLRLDTEWRDISKPGGFPEILRVRPVVLEAVVLSRMEEHATAIDQALHTIKELLKQLENKSPIPNQSSENKHQEHQYLEKGIYRFFYEIQRILKILQPILNADEKQMPNLWGSEQDNDKTIEGFQDRFLTVMFAIPSFLGTDETFSYLEEATLRPIIANSLANILNSRSHLFDSFGVFSHRITRLPHDEETAELYNTIYYLASLSEMLNVLAYSRAELRIPHRFNLIDSLYSIMIAVFLFECAGGNENQFNMHRTRVTQYLDTLGWILYRSRRELRLFGDSFIDTRDNPEKEKLVLEASMKILLRALQYNPGKAIVEYHLVRIYLSQINALWQASDGNIVKRKEIQHFNECLTEALQHWRNAKALDVHNRLSTQLAWIHKRLNEYQTVWSARRIKAIGSSDHDNDSTLFRRNKASD